MCTETFDMEPPDTQPDDTERGKSSVFKGPDINLAQKDDP